MTERRAPAEVRFTVWGMQPGPTDTEQGEPDGIWGHGNYTIDVDAEGHARARLTLGTGDLDLEVTGLDDTPVPEASAGREEPLISVVLQQATAPVPGEKRTLLEGDFDGASIQVVIDGALYVDEHPELTMALDLATGATEIRAEGVLRHVSGAGGDDRSYAIDGLGVTPLDCTYRPYGDEVGSTWIPPEGQIDVCRAMVSKAEHLPTIPETPEVPWDDTAPETETVCGF